MLQGSCSGRVILLHSGSPDPVGQRTEFGERHHLHAFGQRRITYTVKGGGQLRFTIMEVDPGLKWTDTAISGIFSCGG